MWLDLLYIVLYCVLTLLLFLLAFVDPEEGGVVQTPSWKITSDYMFPQKNWYGTPREAIGGLYDPL